MVFNLRADLDVIQQVGHSLSTIRALSSLQSSLTTISIAGFSTAPSLIALATDYSTALIGQPGCLKVAAERALAHADWCSRLLLKTAEFIEAQDSMNSTELQSIHSLHSSIPLQIPHIIEPAPSIPLADLITAPPVVSVELATPLDALISMFQGADSAIWSLSDSWNRCASAMDELAAALHQGSTMIDIHCEGSVFIQASLAMKSYAVETEITSANARIMGASVLELAAIRTASLAALETIKVETELIPEPEIKLITQQTQIAHFCSTILQPALSSALPKVRNFSIDISAPGGGVVTTAQGSSSTVPQNTPQISGAIQAEAPISSASSPKDIHAQTYSSSLSSTQQNSLLDAEKRIIDTSILSGHNGKNEESFSTQMNDGLNSDKSTGDGGGSRVKELNTHVGDKEFISSPLSTENISQSRASATQADPFFSEKVFSSSAFTNAPHSMPPAQGGIASHSSLSSQNPLPQGLSTHIGGLQSHSSSFFIHTCFFFSRIFFSPIILSHKGGNDGRFSKLISNKKQYAIFW